MISHLQAIRKRRAMAAADLAARAGVARQTVYAIEAGSFVPNTVVALRLARALEVTVEELFESGSEAEGEPPKIQAELLNDGRGDADGLVRVGSPVRLCRVGRRWVALPMVGPGWLPGVNGLIAGRQSGNVVSARAVAGNEDNAKTVVVAGCDPAMSILSRFVMARDGVDVAAVECTSRRALELLREGKAHIAGMHLRDAATGEFNLPFVRQAFPRGGFQVITYGKWEQGLVVAAGNPLGIRTVEDLARRKVRMVNRAAGAGSRELLDRLLQAAGMEGAKIRGYAETAGGHLDAAARVLAGGADCCVATRSAAVACGLDFVPLAAERYDLVTLRRWAGEPPVRALLDSLNRSKLRKQLESLAGYDTTETGSTPA